VTRRSCPSSAWSARSITTPGPTRRRTAPGTASSFADHASYGTPAALEDEIALDTGQDISIVEYFEDSELEFPDFIAESVVDPGEAPPDLGAVYSSASHRKNVRDNLAKARLHVRTPPGSLHAGAAGFFSARMTILSAPALKGPFLGGVARFMPQQRIVSR
jgi:hypothetical protein